MTYADVDDVAAGFRSLSEEEKAKADALLKEAGVLIDAVASSASSEAKKVVSCRLVRRSIGDGDTAIPIGATQGSVSALGYAQTWQIGSGSSGEMYLNKTDRQLLGLSRRIGFISALEDMAEGAND